MSEPEGEVEEVRLACSLLEFRALDLNESAVLVDLLVDHLPWWQRLCARVLWRTRLRRFVERRFRSPYEDLYVILRLRPTINPALRARVDALRYK